MSIAVVQKIDQQAAAAAAVTLTLPAAPTKGNLLVVFAAYSQFTNARTISSPAGIWVKAFDVTNSAASCSLACFWHVVQPGDGTSYVFPVAGTTSDNTSGYMWELNGAENADPINQQAVLDIATGTNNVVVTPSVTPSVYGALALATWTFDTNILTFSSVSAGWTLDGHDDATYHGTYSCRRNTVTADTSTAINVTITATGSSGSNDGEAATILIAPARAHVKFNNSGTRPHPFQPGLAR